MSKKIFIIINLTLIMIISIPNIIFAVDLESSIASSTNDIVGDIANWIKEENVTSEKITNRAQIVMGIVNIVGIISSVVVLMILGIRYITGSIEAKAEYKKSMMYYIVGAILLFAAPTLANIIYNISIQVTTV